MFGFSRFTAILGVVALTLTGCDESLTTEDPSLLSAEERSIRNIERQRTETAVAVGAGLGVLTGLAATQGQSREEQLRGALIGGLIGAAAGAATGEYVNTRTRQFSNEQQALQSLIAAADRDIANYRSMNATSANLIQQQRSKVRQLNSRLSNGTESVEGYRAKIASATNNLRSLDKGIVDISKQIEVMKSDNNDLRAAGKSTGQLPNRIASLEQQKRVLEARRRELASVYNEVPDAVGSYTF